MHSPPKGAHTGSNPVLVTSFFVASVEELANSPDSQSGDCGFEARPKYQCLQRLCSTGLISHEIFTRVILNTMDDHEMQLVSRGEEEEGDDGEEE